MRCIETLRGRAARLFPFVLAVLEAPGPLEAQASCRPPRDLFVCQDVYGASGRAFLAWTNGETTYSEVRVTMDGVLQGTGPGSLRSGYISQVPLGRHVFAVEGVCGGAPTAQATATFDFVAATPHTRPVESIDCSFDAARSRLTATWVLSARRSLFVDVYVRRAGLATLIYVASLRGDANSVSVDGAQATDRFRLQFFDEACYGSALVGCAAGCDAPARLRVCQDLYAPRARVFVDWLPGAADYTGYKVYLDGAEVGSTAADTTIAYVDPVSPGTHVFAVRGVCGGELSPPAEASFKVIEASPHTEPARNLHCQHDAPQRTITATWLPGARASDFIDVYVWTPGAPVLDFAGTIAGDATRVRVANAGANDKLVLQFFDAGCYGSPLITCGESPGSRDLLRGDSNGSGRVDLSDSVFSLAFLFLGDPSPLCLDAADSNDDAKLDIADPIFTLSWLFASGPEPPAPGPRTCGPDPTADALAPCLTAACP
ncbi:MAG: hypothetical protein HY721_00130 [Planctomycetes bacterium]|nr:hypothetical protein [Planctomycetota bacterium]